MKNFGKVAVGVVRESRRAHCAVIFAIAQLSCLLLKLLEMQVTANNEA